jgi:hypothetical protein
MHCTQWPENGAHHPEEFLADSHLSHRVNRIKSATHRSVVPQICDQSQAAVTTPSRTLASRHSARKTESV